MQHRKLKICIITILIAFFVLCKELQCLPSISSIEEQSWPPMKHFNIWETTTEKLQRNNFTYGNNNLSVSASSRKKAVMKEKDTSKDIFKDADVDVDRQYISVDANFINTTSHRQDRVLNFFPVPVEDECLSEDGRRLGTCLNPYECRKKDGQAKGECALGFGVCCVFVVSCDREVSSNITYLISPNFPSFMSTNITSCKLKIKMMSPDISQLRIDFHHFLLGQPDRKTGICDGDTFKVSGGPGGDFMLCGLNSGQHVYYDIGGQISSRQSPNENRPPLTSTTKSTTTTEKVTIFLNGTAAPFLMDYGNNISSPANNTNQSDKPNESDDIEITINFGSPVIQRRFWEIQIMQIPFSQRAPAGCLQYFNGLEGTFQTFNFAQNGRHLAHQNYRACFRQETGMCSITYEPCDQQSFRIGPNIMMNDEVLADGVNQADTIIQTQPPIVTTTVAATTVTTIATPIISSENPLTAANITDPPIIQADEVTNSTNSTLADDITEGSGAGDVPITEPTRGGFDILQFLREAFDFRRRRSAKQFKLLGKLVFNENSRQLFSSCTDRITMPCIVEDFIGNGNFGCEPVHCGNQFCSTGGGGSSCRIESTVTPFYLGIHFGDGAGKGSPEDNIGACLKFNQMPCM